MSKAQNVLKGWRSFFEKGASHQPQSDLLSARSDLVKLGVSEESASGVLVDVSVPSEALEGL